MHATLRAASSTTSRPPVRGSSWQKRALPSVASASAFVGALHAQHRGVGARPGDGVEEQLVVVLARHPRLVGDRRRREQREQLAAEVGARPGTWRAAAARDRRPAARPARPGARAGGGSSGPSPRLPTGHVGDRRARPTTRPAASSPSGGAGFSPGTPIASNSPSNTRKRVGVGDAPDDRRADLPPRARARAPRRGSPGSTIASMRSWLSDVMHLDRVHARLALGDARDVDVHARRRPWPRSPTPRTTGRPRRDPARRPRARASSSSRHASISRFSSNGSPTCTDGRFASPPSSKPADASTLAPPMPSRPVDEPSSTARLPAPFGAREHEPFGRQDAEAQARSRAGCRGTCRRTRPRRRPSARRPSCRSR